jgi:hypothetical protein
MARWKFLAAFIFLILVLLYSENRILAAKRQNESFIDVQDFIKQIQVATGGLGQEQSYNSWIGWMYTQPYEYKTAVALNDMKSRLFQPNCKFRADWMNKLPPGKLRPNPAATPDIANMAYKSYFSCLARGDQQCLKFVEDIRQRFMEPSCNYLNPTDLSSYAKNLKTVF